MSPFYGGKCGKCGKEFESYEPTSYCMSCTLTNYRTVTKFKDGGLVPMKTPHKHAELIKAWADGAHIQSRWIPTSDVLDPMWVDDKDPRWDWSSREFRIKVAPPKAKVRRWLWVYKNSSNLWRISTRYLTAQEASAFYSERKKLDFTEMEFDE